MCSERNILEKRLNKLNFVVRFICFPKLSLKYSCQTVCYVSVNLTAEYMKRCLKTAEPRCIELHHAFFALLVSTD